MDSRTPSETDPPSAGWIAPLITNVLRVWQRWLSPFSFPFLNEPNGEENQKYTCRRDATVLALLILSAMAFVCYEPSQPTGMRATIAGYTIWRVADIFLMIISHGIFGGLFVPVPGVNSLFDATRAHLQRVLCLMLLNYLEAIFLFGVLYLAVGEGALAGSTTQSVGFHERAFFVSLSTMSTVGYGTFAPVSAAALAIAAIQSLTVLTFVSMLLGVVMSGLKGDVAQRASRAERRPSRRECQITWGSPLLCFAIISGITFWAMQRGGGS